MVALFDCLAKEAFLSSYIDDWGKKSKFIQGNFISQVTFLWTGRNCSHLLWKASAVFSKRKGNLSCWSNAVWGPAVINSKEHFDWFLCLLSIHCLETQTSAFSRGSESKTIKCIHFLLNCRVKNISVNGGWKSEIKAWISFQFTCDCEWGWKWIEVSRPQCLNAIIHTANYLEWLDCWSVPMGPYPLCIGVLGFCSFQRGAKIRRAITILKQPLESVKYCT